MALVSAQTARSYLIGFDAVQDDDELGTWLTAAEAAIHTWLLFPRPDSGTRSLDSVTYTVYLDGPTAEDTTTIELGIWPVTGITSIGDSSEWDYTQTVSSSEYTRDDAVGKIHLNPTATHAWTHARRAIKVVLTAGFTSADTDVVAAVALTARHLWEVGHTIGKGNAAEGEVSVAESIPPAVRQMLAPYRLWSNAVA